LPAVQEEISFGAIEASLSKAGMQILYAGPEGFAQFLKSQDDDWTKTIKTLDLKM
jgi:hypothetical protein